MDNIKESFERVKEDIFSIKQEINFLKKNLIETREKMVEICEIMIKFKESQEKNSSTDKTHSSTDKTHSSTDKTHIKPLEPKNIGISTGNQGVPADKQTNRQTNRQTEIMLEKPKNPIDNVVEILNSLDDLKKEIRLKFKKLTNQEMIVFNTLYKHDEKFGYSDYKMLSKELNLTESSLRDYVGRLIKKSIPIEKRRINNKNIQLCISNNLKKMSSLSTINQLRDL